MRFRSRRRRTPEPVPRHPAEPVPRHPRWLTAYPLGEPEALKAMGSTSGPLLGGFALASAAVLVTSGDPPPLADWALIAFVTAAAAFLFSVQFSTTALGFAATPEERLMWRPAARSDPAVLADIERIQRMDTRLRLRYQARARWTYRAGLPALLTGLMLICVPDSLDWPRIIATAVTGAALLLELVWLGANILRRHPRWMLPTDTDPGVWEEPSDER